VRALAVAEKPVPSLCNYFSRQIFRDLASPISSSFVFEIFTFDIGSIATVDPRSQSEG
jgi:hypothetical protein